MLMSSQPGVRYPRPTSLLITVTIMCAALYASIGYVLHSVLPIYTPGVGVVRFWPEVVIPGAFAVLFGPLVGGIGAAIGIFISDVLIHHDPILSMTVGVPANFVCFYLVGYISRKELSWRKTLLCLGIGSIIVGIIIYLMMVFLPVETLYAYTKLSPEESTLLFAGACIGSYLLMIIAGYFWPEWKTYGIASVIGLGTGSTIIGFGVWTYSQFFVLPLGWGYQLPLYAAFMWLIWTFTTEIPFLIALGPPILKACYKAFPALSPYKKRGR